MVIKGALRGECNRRPREFVRITAEGSLALSDQVNRKNLNSRIIKFEGRAPKIKECIRDDFDLHAFAAGSSSDDGNRQWHIPSLNIERGRSDIVVVVALEKEIVHADPVWLLAPRIATLGGTVHCHFRHFVI